MTHHFSQQLQQTGAGLLFWRSRHCRCPQQLVREKKDKLREKTRSRCHVLVLWVEWDLVQDLGVAGDWGG